MARTLTVEEAAQIFFKDNHEAVSTSYIIEDEVLADLWSDAHFEQQDYFQALSDLEDYFITKENENDTLS